MTLQLLFYVCITYEIFVITTLVRHCDVVFITSQFRDLFVECIYLLLLTLELRFILAGSNCVRKLRYSIVTF